jgi:uncharacterized protein YktB (UPF0637 family)
VKLYEYNKSDLSYQEVKKPFIIHNIWILFLSILLIASLISDVQKSKQYKKELLKKDLVIKHIAEQYSLCKEDYLELYTYHEDKFKNLVDKYINKK